VVVLAATGQLTVLSATVALLGVTLLVRVPVAVLLCAPRAVVDARPGRLRVSPRLWAYDVVVSCSGLTDMLLACRDAVAPEVGIYAVGHAVGRIALAPFSALAPSLTGLGPTGAATPGRLMLTSGVAVVGGAVALGGFLAAGPPLVGLVYGSAFTGAYRVGALLLVVAILTGVTTHMEAWALGRAAAPVPRAPAGDRGADGDGGALDTHDTGTAGPAQPRQRCSPRSLHRRPSLPAAPPPGSGVKILFLGNDWTAAMLARWRTFRRRRPRHPRHRHLVGAQTTRLSPSWVFLKATGTAPRAAVHRFWDSVHEAAREFRPDLLFCFKTVQLPQSELLGLGVPMTVHYSPDDVSNPVNISDDYLAHEKDWTLVVTTKSFTSRRSGGGAARPRTTSGRRTTRHGTTVAPDVRCPGHA
jgi:hypothetical protein